jgi:hypothetical protein
MQLLKAVFLCFTKYALLYLSISFYQIYKWGGYRKVNINKQQQTFKTLKQKKQEKAYVYYIPLIFFLLYY